MQSEKNPDHYVMMSVPFGDEPSGAIAMTAMNETAKMNQTVLPEAADAILHNTYVDDILPSVPTIDQAINLTKNIERVLNNGGFTVKHWIISGLGPHSNSKDIDVKIADINEGSVLGMIWLPKEDILKFKTNLEFGPKQAYEILKSNITPEKFPEI